MGHPHFIRMSHWAMQTIAATLTQLFSGLGDGTVSADLIVVDSVGNTQSILGTSWTLNTSTPSISVILSGDYSGQFVTNDSTGFHSHYLQVVGVAFGSIIP